MRENVRKRPKTFENARKRSKTDENVRKHRKRPIFFGKYGRRQWRHRAAAGAAAAAAAVAAAGPKEPSLIVSIFRLAPLVWKGRPICEKTKASSSRLN